MSGDAGRTQIREGDLVRVAQDCCGVHLGAYHVVVALSHDTGDCDSCGYHTPAPETHALFAEEPGCGMPVRWLRRVPPLEDLEGRREERREPEILEV